MLAVNSPKLYPIYAYSFFDKFIFIFLYYSLLFQESSLSAYQIGILFAVWSISTAVLEIPSGMVADVYSRRKVLIVAQIFYLGVFLSWWLMPGFPGFLLGFVFWGLKSSFTSGTYKAYLYDLLKSHKSESVYRQVRARCRTFSSVGFSLSALGAMVLFRWGSFDALLVFSLLSAAASLLSIVLTAEVETQTELDEVASVYDMFAAIRRLFTNRSIIWMIVIALVWGSISKVEDEYSVLMLAESGLTTALIGGIGFIWGVVEAISGWLMSRYEDISMKHLSFTLIALSVIYVTIGYRADVVSIVLTVLVALLFPIVDLLTDEYLQHRFDDEVRATSGSVIGLLSRAVAFGMFSLSGAIIEPYGYGGVYVVLGVICFGMGMYVLYRGSKDQL